ncbi:lipoprotein 17-related variable surface protein [Mycoplasmopsis agassizii]|uniref:Lipoprotein-associated type-17 domain-containing protein n=1 Tax=Mycoplasmopsis agassizii TaxID=33922 RepID=A0ABX4H4E0_9BACT|nr:lipoprotein 17-related variable surface protein [Mycoplasmopsis agassizii]PAF54756.1 hypothetical protein CJF60_03395 [Mycoplasmopsis agassizii]SMC19515.1 Lipoprotein associated domain-containing protein [Mycoplasmopsis agassizii]
MKRKFLITTVLSLGSAIAVTAAIACSPIDKPLIKDTVELTLAKIATSLKNFELTIKDKDLPSVIKTKVEAITSDFETKLVELATKGKLFSEFLGEAKITSLKVSDQSPTSLSLELGLSYTEEGETSTNKTTIKIVGLGTRVSTLIQEELATIIAKFTDRDLKDTSKEKELLPSKTTINNLETWNINTSGEVVAVDNSITVTFTKVSSDTTKGVTIFKVTLTKQSETSSKDIKVSGFKTKLLNADEKDVETTFNNFTLKVANFDRGAEKLTVESFVEIDTGNDSGTIYEYRFEKNPDWLLSMSNSNSRASAFKPTVLDSKTFPKADYFSNDIKNHLQARLKEKDQIKLEQGVSAKVRIVTADDIKGEVVVALTFIKGDAKSDEKFLTIKNFLDQKELGSFAYAIYGKLVDTWNRQDKNLKPGFSDEATALKYIELMQKTFDDQKFYPNDVSLMLAVDTANGGIDYDKLEINLIGTYILNNVVLATNKIVLQGFNDSLSGDAKLVLEASNNFNIKELQARNPVVSDTVNEARGGLWIPSRQHFNSLEELNEKLSQDHKIMTWPNKNKGVILDVKTIGFNGVNGSVTLQFNFKKGNIISEPITVTLKGFFIDAQVFDIAKNAFKAMLETKDQDGVKVIDKKIQEFVVYIALPQTSENQRNIQTQLNIFGSYFANLINFGSPSDGIPGLSWLGNTALVRIKHLDFNGNAKFVVMYNGLESEEISIKLPKPQFKGAIIQPVNVV